MWDVTYTVQLDGEDVIKRDSVNAGAKRELEKTHTLTIWNEWYLNNGQVEDFKEFKSLEY